jgi:hypothetical protein
MEAEKRWYNLLKKERTINPFHFVTQTTSFSFFVKYKRCLAQQDALRGGLFICKYEKKKC